MKEDLIRIIHALINLDVDWNLSTNKYGLSNYIAKFSLANTTYLASSRAHERLQEHFMMNPQLNNIMRRSHRKQLNLMFEHVIPVKLIMAEFRSMTDKSLNNVRAVLEGSSYVVILDRDENSILDAEVRSTMPEHINGWFQILKNPFARYDQCNIEMARDERGNHVQIKMTGAILR